jgi:hypothetical protein
MTKTRKIGRGGRVRDSANAFTKPVSEIGGVSIVNLNWPAGRRPPRQCHIVVVLTTMPHRPGCAGRAAAVGRVASIGHLLVE